MSAYVRDRARQVLSHLQEDDRRVVEDWIQAREQTAVSRYEGPSWVRWVAGVLGAGLAFGGFVDGCGRAWTYLPSEDLATCQEAQQEYFDKYNACLQESRAWESIVSRIIEARAKQGLSVPPGESSFP